MVVVVKVGEVEDFSIEPQELHTESVSETSSSSEPNDPKLDSSFFFFPIFYISSSAKWQISSNKQAFAASKTMVGDCNNNTHTLVVIYS